MTFNTFYVLISYPRLVFGYPCYNTCITDLHEYNKMYHKVTDIITERFHFSRRWLTQTQTWTMTGKQLFLRLTLYEQHITFHKKSQ